MNIVFATNNINKIIEIQSLIPNHISILNLKSINCNDELPENQNTISGNALQKAQYIFEKYRCNVFADDTGLEVDALLGAPGVYSARYAGAHCSDQDNIDLLLKNLLPYSQREAQFKTVIALIINGETHCFTGICKGEITTTKQGSNGFGYDPIFKPIGYTKTFGALSLEEKNKVSHRAIATLKLVEFLNQL